MKITVEGNTAYVETPYNAEFVAAIKAIGGAKWNRDKSTWGIPAASVPQAREIMRSIYGMTDEPDASPMVSVELTFADDLSECGKPVTIYGKTLARAYNRDGGARCGDDVAYTTGKPTSGGSRINWCSVVPQGSVVVLHNVPESMLDKPLPAGVTCKRLETTIDRDALAAEKARLLARIAEIDKLLSEG